MIDKTANPIGWALFLYELNDAHEHLGGMIKSLAESAEYSEGELIIELGHVYAHLNRAWCRRNASEDLTEAEWEAASRFPTDLMPVG